MTAVIYARYSSDNQREESIEGQIRECTAYAEKNGITIVKHYIDRAISAKTDNRPEFQQMIKDSDKKLFDKAEDDYLLTTKLFCGYCGALMFGESGTSRTGEVHRYYKCATAKKHKGCKKKTVRKQWLEDLVVNQTMQLVKDDAAMESIIAKVMELQNKENTNIPLYEKQLRDAESGIQNMLNAIQAGILTSSTKERLEQLEETKRELEARIAEEKLAKPKVTEEFIRFWLLRFRKLDMSLKDQRQALVDTFINAIYLYDDKVLITFNYKEGTQTVTFGEATEVASEGNGSDLDCFTAMEGTRTPGLLIRRNRIAHFVHFIIQRQIVVLIESQLFFRCYSVASFALLARLCTCYPSLRCAENVQKCAEPKSARQNRLFRTAPKAGFQRYLLCKIFQFYPNNNLT